MSPSRETHRPIEHIVLKVAIEGDKSELASLHASLPSSTISKKVFSYSIETAEADKAIGELRSLSQAIKVAEKKSERL